MDGASKKYSVVSFPEEDDEIGVVLSKWVFFDQKRNQIRAYYPPPALRKHTNKMQNLLAKEKDYIPEWGHYPVKFLQRYNILNNALLGAKAAEMESQLESESSLSVLKKRQSKKPTRYESEDSGLSAAGDDSSDAENKTKAKVAKKKRATEDKKSSGSGANKKEQLPEPPKFDALNAELIRLSQKKRPAPSVEESLPKRRLFVDGNAKEWTSSEEERPLSQEKEPPKKKDIKKKTAEDTKSSGRGARKKEQLPEPPNFDMLNDELRLSHKKRLSPPVEKSLPKRRSFDDGYAMDGTSSEEEGALSQEKEPPKKTNMLVKEKKSPDLLMKSPLKKKESSPAENFIRSPSKEKKSPTKKKSPSKKKSPLKEKNSVAGDKLSHSAEEQSPFKEPPMSARSFRADSPSRSFRADSPSRSFRADSPSRSFRAVSPSRSSRADSPICVRSPSRLRITRKSPFKGLVKSPRHNRGSSKKSASNGAISTEKVKLILKGIEELKLKFQLIHINLGRVLAALQTDSPAPCEWPSGMPNFPLRDGETLAEMETFLERKSNRQTVVIVPRLKRMVLKARFLS